MTILELLLWALWGWFCWFMGRRYQTGLMIQGLLSNSREIKNILDRLAQQETLDESQTEPDRIAIRAEWIGDQVYLYVEATGQFLAQGADIDTAIDRITDYIPGCDYVLPKEMATKPQKTQP